MANDARRIFEIRNFLHTILLILGMAAIIALLGYSLFGLGDGQFASDSQRGGGF